MTAHIPPLTVDTIGEALNGEVVDIDGTPGQGAVGFVHQGDGHFHVTLFDEDQNDLLTHTFILVETP